jgi:hypothetical protein
MQIKKRLLDIVCEKILQILGKRITLHTLVMSPLDF